MENANRRHHIFGDPTHNLDPLVRQYGNEEAAGCAIVEAVRAAFAAGSLIADDDGLYRQIFDVGGNSVTVSGRVVNGVARISTAWIPS
jgi:hypothetical protein